MGGYVVGVTSGSPATKAGLSAGDRIISVGSTKVSTTTQLQIALLLVTSFKSVQIAYMNPTGVTMATTVSLAAWPKTTFNEPQVFAL